MRTDQPEDAARVLTELGLPRRHPHRRADRTAPSTRPRHWARSTRGAIVPALVGAGVPVLGFSVDTPSLEDLFVKLTGEGFDVSG